MLQTHKKTPHEIRKNSVIETQLTVLDMDDAMMVYNTFMDIIQFSQSHYLSRI